jgi:hypothetical protein
MIIYFLKNKLKIILINRIKNIIMIELIYKFQSKINSQIWCIIKKYILVLFEIDKFDKNIFHISIKTCLSWGILEYENI